MSQATHTPVGARWLKQTKEPGVCLRCGAAVPAKVRALWLMNRGILCQGCGLAYEAEGNPTKDASNHRQ